MNEFVICATRSMKHYAGLVASDLTKFPNFSGQAENFSQIDLLEPKHFADGELEVNVNSSIRGKNVFIFTSCARNEDNIDVSDAKIELYHSVDALKRSQAAKIIVFEPYVTCSRSDRNIRRSSVGLWVHFKTLASLGASHIVTYQLHSDKSKAMVDPTLCGFDDIPAQNLLAQYLCDNYIMSIDKLENEVISNWAFCSVDAGGEKLARVFANAFGTPLVIAHKQRDSMRQNTVESINILTAEPIHGKTLWIVDDMVDTAGSVSSLVYALNELKPKEVNIISVHAVFSDPAPQIIAELNKKGLLNKIIVTDTVCCTCSLLAKIPGLEIVPSIGLSANIIMTIATNASLGKLLRTFDAKKYLKPPNLFN